jgi:nuclear migration protein JNM1
VDGKRKSYKASTRRQRILADGTHELGDLSDEEDEENLERKLARLKRELEEVKEEYGKRKGEAKNPKENGVDPETQLSSLSKVLDDISRSSEAFRESTLRGPATGSQPAAAGAKERPQPREAEADSATYTITYTPTYEQSHALAKATDFDRRLVLLEKSVGISSTVVPGVDPTGLPRAIMPTLESLQKQISTLSQASTSSLDGMSRRIRTLIQEAEQLEKARVQAKAAQDALGTTPAAVNGSDDSEQVAKINALYGTLPTIENLTPLLPSLLDRLRSLRAIHADAATASETLDRIEKQQADMAADLRQWRDGLGKVEEAVKQGETAMSGNMKVMDGWVKDLEGRMSRLP